MSHVYGFTWLGVAFSDWTDVGHGYSVTIHAHPLVWAVIGVAVLLWVLS